ncbi:MAG: plastocyanin/azurin family copper-binding protein [Puniceicoccales bacterium]
MTFRIFFLSIALLGALSACGPQPPKPAAVPEKKTISNAAGIPKQKVELATLDSLRFSKTLLEVPANKKITLTLHNEGRMPREIMVHNLVVLKPGSDINLFTAESSFAEDTDYIPEEYEDWIVAHTKTLAAGESETITFRAPKVPGEYPFICSYPGHAAAGMKGIMRVVVETTE